MVGAEHLRIVFRVNDTGFVMPVADLLAIRGPGEDELTLTSHSGGSLQLGTMAYRETDVMVYDFASLFELGEYPAPAEHLLLIFAGADGPWAVPVDHVSGVVNESGLMFQDLPEYLFRDGTVPYHQVAVYQEQLLVSTDVQQVEETWRRSG